MRSQLARLTPGLLNRGLDRLQVLAGKGRRLTPTRRRILRNIEAARQATLPLPNVMLGVSAEDRHWWKIRVPVLTSVPAAARFVSAEPLLHELGPRSAGSRPRLAAISWTAASGSSTTKGWRRDPD